MDVDRNNKEPFEVSIKTNKYLYGIYLFLFVLMAIFANRSNILFDAILLIAISLFVFTKSIRILSLMYLFYVFWDNVLVFNHIGISAGLLIDVIFATKILLSRRFIQKKHFFFLAYLLTYAIINRLVATTLTGFSLTLEWSILIYIKELFNKEEDYDKYFFLTITVSILLSSFFGLINGLTNTRLIIASGTHVNQLASTTSTARTGIYCLIGSIFPLFFCKKPIIKWCLIAVFVVIIISTVSITAIIGMCIFYLIYFLFSKSDKGSIDTLAKKIGIIVSGIIAVLVIFRFFGNNQYVHAVYNRINTIIIRYNAGDMRVATSGRTGLHALYWDYFCNLNIFNKIFGTGLLSARTVLNATNYSHLTYLDILICYGWIGFAIYFIAFADSIRSKVHNNSYLCFVLLKAMIIWVASSTSLLTNPDWFVLFLV